MQKAVEKRIAENLGVSLKRADEILNATIAALKEEIAVDKDLRIREFGSFKTVHRPSRQGRNPATGAAITIPAKNAMKFVPSKALKELINE